MASGGAHGEASAMQVSADPRIVGRRSCPGGEPGRPAGVQRSNTDRAGAIASSARGCEQRPRSIWQPATGSPGRLSCAPGRSASRSSFTSASSPAPSSRRSLPPTNSRCRRASPNSSASSRRCRRHRRRRDRPAPHNRRPTRPRSKPPDTVIPEVPRDPSLADGRGLAVPGGVDATGGVFAPAAVGRRDAAAATASRATATASAGARGRRSSARRRRSATSRRAIRSSPSSRGCRAS